MAGELIVLGLLGIILLLVPSSLFFLLYIVFYIHGRRYEVPRTNAGWYGKISVIIPIRKEPLELLDDALKHLSNWKNTRFEAIIVSDDPPENLPGISRIVEKWRGKGLDIVFIWRSEPRGFRTGALNTGLYAASGDYLYVMDVDSRVNESFIRKAASLIHNGRAVAVVARWTGKNWDSRIAEAISASMKFIVDSLYRGRSALKLPVFPVGTGTVYDKRFLRDVLKGWDEDRIQDDMEIGSRIMWLGGKILFIDNEPVYVEVPRRFKSLRIQQERWSYGATDVAIARFRHIIHSKQPWYAKLEAFNFLLQYLPAMLGLIGFITILLSVFFEGVDVFGVYWWIGAPWLVLSGLYSYFYILSLREAGFNAWRSIVNLGRSAAITVSLTPTISAAIFRALLRMRFAYKRTPKGKHEGLLSGYRFPWELVTGLFVLFSSLWMLYFGYMYTGLWGLSYSAGYIYSCIRWFNDIIHG